MGPLQTPLPAREQSTTYVENQPPTDPRQDQTQSVSRSLLLTAPHHQYNETPELLTSASPPAHDAEHLHRCETCSELFEKRHLLKYVFLWILAHYFLIRTVIARISRDIPVLSNAPMQAAQTAFGIRKIYLATAIPNIPQQDPGTVRTRAASMRWERARYSSARTTLTDISGQCTEKQVSYRSLSIPIRLLNQLR